MRHIGEAGVGLAVTAMLGWLAFELSDDFGIAFLVAGIVGIALVWLSVWWERGRNQRSGRGSA